MNVRLGWSGEVHGVWQKMDVEVDENDLILHFMDAGCENVEKLTFSPVEKFKLMYALAETFVQLHKMSRYPDIFNTTDGKNELADLIRSRDKLTALILERCK